jgi:hypothetical protein
MKRIPLAALAAFCVFALILPVILKSSGYERERSMKDEHSPKVVARLEKTFRVADLPATVTLFTPEESGLYRINGYAEVITSDPNGAVYGQFTFDWTDDIGDKGPQIAPGSSGNCSLIPTCGQNLPKFALPLFAPGAFANTTFVIREVKSTPLTFTASNAIVQGGIAGDNEFSVYFTVEKLSGDR